MKDQENKIKRKTSWGYRILFFTIFLILVSSIITSCQVFDLGSTSSDSPVVIENWLPTPSPTETLDLASIPTSTIAPTLTSTPAPTITSSPSVTPSPTAARINTTNAPGLKPYQIYPVPFLQGEIRSAAWAPGERAIILHTTKGIHLLDPNSLQELTFYPGLLPLGESESGLILTKTEATLGWIDLNSGKYQAFSIPNFATDVEPLPISLNPQGDTLVTVDMEHKDTLIFYRFPGLEVQQELTITHEKGVRSVNQILFTLDGEDLFLEILRRDGRLGLILLNLDNPGITVDMGVENSFRELTPNPSGEFLAYQSDTPTVRKISTGTLWNTLSASFTGTLQNNSVEYVATSISFQDDNSLAVSYRSVSRNPESIVIMRDINSGQTIQTYTGIPGRVISLDFSSDGSLFLITTEEGFVRIYNQQGQEVLTSDRYDIKHNMDISPDGQWVAVPTHKGIEIYDPTQGLVTQTFGDYPSTDHIDAIFVDQETLAISVYPYVGEPYTELWDIKNGELLNRYNLANCSFSTNGDYIACSSRSVQVLDLERGLLIGNFGRANQTFYFQLSPYGRYLAICSYEMSPDKQVISYQNVIWLLDIISGTRMRDLFKEGPACGKLAFTNSGLFLVAASGGIWSIPEGELKSVFNGSPEAEIIMHPNSNLFMIENRIIAIPSGQELGQIEVTDHPLSIRYTTDGTRLVILTENELSYLRVNP